MKKAWLLPSILAIFLCMAGIFPGEVWKGANADMNTYDVTVYPMPCMNGVRNPLKGLRAAKQLDTRFGSTVRWYIEWNEIEQTAADGVEKLVEFGQQHWGSLATRLNSKVIPRVYLEWPKVGKYWPKDMTENDYTSPVFIERLKNMIYKMAKAWDNDPQIAYIEMGLIGYWGEMHSPDPTEEIQRVLLDTFSEYFVNKKVMVRYPKTILFDKGNFGLYWDEWGSEMQWSEWDKINLVLTEKYKDRWKTAVFGGENTNNLYTYDPTGGAFMTYGLDYGFPASTAFSECYGEMVNYARLTHTNHLGTSWPQEIDKVAWRNACNFQDVLGYAFVLQNASFNHIDAQSRMLDFSFTVKNTGASPFYEDWPVAVSLLDPANKLPVYTALLPDCSVSDWMPGEEWQKDTQQYAIPAQLYTVTREMALPETVKEGTYLLALSIVDPAGMRNAAVFLNAGYTMGGYTILGEIGLGQEPAQSGKNAGKLIPESDITLRYYANLALLMPCSHPELTDGLSSTNCSLSEGESATIDLGGAKRVYSMTLCPDQAFSFRVEASKDGENWNEVAGEVFAARDNVLHWKPDVTRAQFIRITAEQEASISQIRIFGE